MPLSFGGGLARARALRNGETFATGWTALPSPLNAASLARGGFPVVTADMQHGLHDEASVFGTMQAVLQAGASPGLRIPVGRFDIASRALDAGAQVIIAPMINTEADARALVDATKYPGTGKRSWGPSLAIDLWGADAAAYLAGANTLTVTFAMIETAEAVANLDAILGVEGIDGVFVGPSDLSITLSQGARLEPRADAVLEATRDIGARARAAGRIAGVYAFDADKAREFAGWGFTFVAVGSDAAALRAYAAAGHALA